LPDIDVHTDYTDIRLACDAALYGSDRVAAKAMPAVRAYTPDLPSPDRARMVRTQRVTSHRERGSGR
jgi:hypothetical protein